jgi:hypothetical protein
LGVSIVKAIEGRTESIKSADTSSITKRLKGGLKAIVGVKKSTSDLSYSPAPSSSDDLPTGSMMGSAQKAQLMMNKYTKSPLRDSMRDSVEYSSRDSVRGSMDVGKKNLENTSPPKMSYRNSTLNPLWNDSESISQVSNDEDSSYEAENAK